MATDLVNVLGESLDMTYCDECGGKIDLNEGDFGVFGTAYGDGKETNYRLATLCKPDCFREYALGKLGAVEARGTFAEDE